MTDAKTIVKKGRELERKGEEAIEDIAEKADDLIQHVEKEIPKVKDTVDEKIKDVEAYIKKEPLKSVTASFMLGLLIGRMMK
ncbi:MAG: hypothetical protein ACP5N9_01050 [Candidatus Bilamarchaeum sp.]|jgi:ElaB/YqjD/DUF883 family membrane-anchored ribosome-binding protein